MVTVAGAARALRGVLYLSAAAPLLALPGLTYYPFVAPRVHALRVLAACAVPLLALVWSDPSRRPRGAVAWSLGALVTVFALTLLVGEDAALGLHGGGGRMTGLVTLGALVVFALSALTVLGTPPRRTALLTAMAAAGVALGIHAALERVGVTPTYQRFHGRTSSTLGNPVFLGSHGALVTVVGAWLAVRTSGWRRGLGAAAVVAGLVCVIVSESRGPALGLAAGAVVSALVAAVVLPTESRVRRWVRWWPAALLVIVAALGAAHAAGAGDGVTLWRRVRAASLESPDVQRRILLWKTAIAAGREAPLLGHGPGTFAAVSERLAEPALHALDERQVNADHAHGEAVNTFAEQGALGLLAYLALLGAPLAMLLRGHERGAASAPTLVFGAGMLSVVFVRGLFAPEDVTGLHALFLTVGLLDAESRPDRLPVSTAPVAPAVRATLLLAALVALPAAFLFDLRPFAASIEIARGFSNPTTSSGVDDAWRAVSLLPEPHRRAAAYDFAAVALQVSPTLPADRARALLDRAFRELDRVEEPGPGVRRAVSAGSVATVLAETYGDHRHVEAAVAQLAAASAAAPRRVDAAFASARLLALQGRNAEALALAQSACALAPDAPDACLRLAWLHASAGRPLQGQAVLLDALARGVTFPERLRPHVDRLMESR